MNKIFHLQMKEIWFLLELEIAILETEGLLYIKNES